MNSQCKNSAQSTQPPVRSGLILIVAGTAIALVAAVVLAKRPSNPPAVSQAEPAPAAIEQEAPKPLPPTWGQRLAAARDHFIKPAEAQPAAAKATPAATPATNSIYALQAQESAVRAREVIAMRTAGGAPGSAALQDGAESSDVTVVNPAAPSLSSGVQPSSVVKGGGSEGVNAYREGDRVRRSVSDEMRKMRAAAILEARRKEASNQ